MYLNLVLEELAEGTEITLRCMATLLKDIEDAQRRERVEEHRVRQDFKPQTLYLSLQIRTNNICHNNYPWTHSPRQAGGRPCVGPAAQLVCHRVQTPIIMSEEAHDIEKGEY
jgi:hypothetical protein